MWKHYSILFKQKLYMVLQGNERRAGKICKWSFVKECAAYIKPHCMGKTLQNQSSQQSLVSWTILPPMWTTYQDTIGDSVEKIWDRGISEKNQQHENEILPSWLQRLISQFINNDEVQICLYEYYNGLQFRGAFHITFWNLLYMFYDYTDDGIHISTWPICIWNFWQ